MNEMIVKNGNELMIDAEVAHSFALYEKQMKELKDKEDAIKKQLLKEMESHGIIKIDSEELLISYIAPSDRERFDSKAFKKDHADLYDEYITMTPVKASLRIKVKDHE